MIVLDQFNDGNAEDLNAILELYADAFFRWKAKTTYRQTQRAAKAFPVWWILKGPTGFKVHEDLQQFRRLLLAVIEHRESRSAMPEAIPDVTEESASE